MKKLLAVFMMAGLLINGGTTKVEAASFSYKVKNYSIYSLFTGTQVYYKTVYCSEGYYPKTTEGKTDYLEGSVFKTYYNTVCVANPNGGVNPK